jgi:serine protease Do
MDPNGYIVTNNHVVEGATQITVTLSDRREFPAKIIGTDPKTDLAVVKIDVKDLPSVKWAEYEKLQVGDLVPWALSVRLDGGTSGSQITKISSKLMRRSIRVIRAERWST